MVRDGVVGRNGAVVVMLEYKCWVQTVVARWV